MQNSNKKKNNNNGGAEGESSVHRLDHHRHELQDQLETHTSPSLISLKPQEDNYAIPANSYLAKHFIILLPQKSVS